MVMKQLRYLFFSSFILFYFSLTHGRTSFELKLQPTWQELDTNQERISKFGGKWILASTIELRKRSTKEVYLEQLVLHWNGTHLENLLGSLYKKELDKPLLPFEEHLICDSYWNKSAQKLILKFDRPLSLEAHLSLCLVLTVPPVLEQTIKCGSFVLESNSLPSSIRNSLTNQSFTLAFN